MEERILKLIKEHLAKLAKGVKRLDKETAEWSISSYILPNGAYRIDIKFPEAHD